MGQCDNFHKLGVLFVSVLMRKASQFGVHIRPPDFGKLPYGTKAPWLQAVRSTDIEPCIRRAWRRECPWCCFSGGLTLAVPHWRSSNYLHNCEVYFRYSIISIDDYVEGPTVSLLLACGVWIANMFCYSDPREKHRILNYCWKILTQHF